MRQLELEVRRQDYLFTHSEDKAEESADSLYVCLFLVCSKLSLRWWDCQWWRIVWQVSTVLSLLMVRYYSTAIIHSSSSMYILVFKQHWQLGMVRVIAMCFYVVSVTNLSHQN